MITRNQSNMKNMDPKTGFCPATKTFHSLRPPLHLPPPTTPISAASFALSLLSTSPFPHSTAALINSATATTLSYTQLLQQVTNLSSSLQTDLHLTQNDVAFILSPNTTHLPVLFLSLLSIGVTISPSNPLSKPEEISRQIELSKPVIAFATSATACKVPELRRGTLLIDSPQFESMMMTQPAPARLVNQPRTSSEGSHMSPCSSSTGASVSQSHVAALSQQCGIDSPEFESMMMTPDRVNVSQGDVAAIFYSSGTTGRGKGAMITHRNLIAAIAYHYASRIEKSEPTVVLYTVPYFHIFGFLYCLRSIALKETAVVMERFDFRKMLRAVEEFRVSLMPVAPPVVVALVKEDVVDEYDLRSLEWVGSGGAPLGIDVIRKFAEKYPDILLAQGYALTETTGVASRSSTPEEIRRWGSVGKLLAMFEAKIVDPDSGASLPPRRRGELWLRSPSLMKGYVGNAKATLETLGADGWLRTGGICYFDDEGYLFVVDRLKELIKYKGYQVAPAELDELLLSHPRVLDAAVIPYPDEEAGEIPMAFVVRHSQSSLAENEVMDFVAKQVAPFKKIRRVRFVTSIPKSPAGKILRKELRKIAMMESKI